MTLARSAFQLSVSIPPHVFSQPEFISSVGDKGFVDLCSSNPTDVWHKSRHEGREMIVWGGKRHNIFQNDPTQGPLCSGRLSVLNITSAVSLSLSTAGSQRRPWAEETGSEEARAMPRHTSSLNIVLKRNWLHLNRRSDKSRWHYGWGAGFIANGTMTVPRRAVCVCVWGREGQIQTVSYGRALG